MATPRHPALAIGTVVGDRYRVARVVGDGAMGTVYECDDAGRAVALKTLHDPEGRRDSAERRARFLREAAVCAQIRHPNVVPVLDHGVDAKAGVPYLVMPLLAGEDLARVLEKTGALSPRACARIFVQAARGVGAAHAAGVVHRDVKPSNLFLVDDGAGALTVKVADFGLAKVFDDAIESLTASGRFMGTPHYVSPEQATNAKRVDARTDVWSLAMSLYHALSGSPAFGHTKSFMALVLDLTGPAGVPPLQDRAPWIEPALARVVHGALVQELDARCPSAAELALGIESAVGVDDSRAPLATVDVRAPDSAERARVAPRAELPSSWDELLRS
jgi:serine/threonine-protein kinase